MSREADLLFGMLALQLGFVSKEQLLECAAVWMSGGAASLAGLLRQRGYVKEGQEAPLRALIEAQLRLHGGDAEKTLRSGAVDPAIGEELRRLGPAPELERTLSAIGSRAGRKPPAPEAAGERYRLGDELGRGGLGRVVEAHDNRLKRQVAVKLVLDTLPSDLTERFVREAELAGKLEHPNIVPVYDFGERATAEGRTRPFIVMKRIRGRDLGAILRSLRAGDPAARETWSRMRLLQIFQDVCQGIAFAHDRGVIHRDLKPANVMIGDFGETLVLDWGLARLLSAGPEPGRAPAPATDSSRIELTVEGDVLGTPSYMPPEQAEGRLAAVDQRSDVYSLGAILYEILTWHPPFEGTSIGEIMTLVKSGRLQPPSSRVAQLAGPAVPLATSHTVLRASAHPGIPAPVPPELDTICLKAMAFAPADRHAAALDLLRDVQLFIEGVREQERARRLADEAVARARGAANRAEELRGSLPAAVEAVARATAVLRRKPSSGRESVWAAQDAEQRLRLDIAEAESGADLAATEALGHDPSHPAARHLKADIAWKRFLIAEEAGNAAEMLLHRRMVERYNDGAFDVPLRGAGTLTLRTNRFPCDCLRTGRLFQPREIAWEGYHPFSGKRLEGPAPNYGVGEAEPSSPVTLRAHGASCEVEDAPGADVWIWRFVDETRLRVPVTPEDAGPPGPAAPVHAVFEPSSPFRPRGPGLYLGRTPLRDLPVPMGSWLAIIAREGTVPRRVPFRVPRCGTVRLDVTLFAPEEIPQGTLPVQGGAFFTGGDRASPNPTARRAAATTDFFYTVHNVTCAEYAAFLEDLERSRPGEAARRAPRPDAESPPYWPGPPWTVPTRERVARMDPALAGRVGRIERTPFDWEEGWPALGITWLDAMAWCRWKRGLDGRPWTLAISTGWERAARGDDERYFPFGDSFDCRWANMLYSFEGSGHPVDGSLFPHDEGPFGHRHLCGNVRTICLDRSGSPEHDWRATRGGDWAESELYARAAGEFVQATDQATYLCGFRAAVPVRLG